MEFNFSRHNLNKKQQKIERFFEILPGLLSWTILLGMVCLSFYAPLTTVVIIIAFDLYWLMRLFYMNIFLVLSYMRLSIEKETDWMARARELNDVESYLKSVSAINAKGSFKHKLAAYIHKREVYSLLKNNKDIPKIEDLYHLVIIPIASEEKDIIDTGIESIKASKFPAERIVIIMALEGRAGDEVKQGVYEIEKNYKKYFKQIVTVEHPDGIEDEAKVKGANAAYAAKKAYEYFTEKKVPFENIIVSCFDADTVVSKDYFSCLSYNYMIQPDRTRCSFQPIPVYHNNIWKAPAFARVLDVGSSFFQLIEATNPEQLVTFSSHSMSFRALVDVGYWPRDMISDDSAIFWKAFIHFDGKYKVVPMYVTLSMDVTEAENWWKTIINVYKQKRRWAWGVENIPIVIRAFLQNKKISLLSKLKHAFKLFESHISWSTWPFLLTFIGWLPAMLARKKYADSILYYSAPRITGTIFSLASFGLIVCILLSLCLLPQKKVKHNFLRRLGHAFEWLLIPPITVVLSAIPALDAQTRLMLGKYMEFWVTIKKR